MDNLSQNPGFPKRRFSNVLQGLWIFKTIDERRAGDWEKMTDAGEMETFLC